MPLAFQSIILNVILLFVILFLYLGMDKEGRHFLSMKLKKSGISFISMNPAGGLSLKRLKFNGTYFEDKKDAIFFGLDLLSNPEDDNQKKYNALLKRTAYWEGSKMPVLLGTDIVNFVSNPHLITKLEEIKNHKDYEEISPIIEKLQKIIGPETVKATFVTPFTPSTLREYISASTPAKTRTTYEKGEISGIMRMTKPKVPGGDMGKIILPIGIIILALILWQSGALDQLLNLGGGA